jgi:LysM repeat protein
MKISGVGGEFSQQPSGNQHVVQEGETTKTIANMHDISVDELKLANPGLSDFPAAGQSLMIPEPRAVQSIIGGHLNSDATEIGATNAFSDALQNSGRAAPQFTLTPDLFSFNNDGHLLVKDQGLTEHFRQHLETQTPTDVRAIIIVNSGPEAAQAPEGLGDAEARAIVIEGGKPAVDSAKQAEVGKIKIDQAKEATEAGGVILENNNTAFESLDELPIARNGFEILDDGSLLIKDTVVSDAFRNVGNEGIGSKAIIIIC